VGGIHNPNTTFDRKVSFFTAPEDVKPHARVIAQEIKEFIDSDIIGEKAVDWNQSVALPSYRGETDTKNNCFKVSVRYLIMKLEFLF